jgi:LCP family protein required for cell wall assembly
VGGVMLAKALAGVLLIFVATGAGTAAAGYFQFDKLFPPADAPLPGGGTAPPALQVPKLPEVKPGGPRTLLLLGSDHRAKTSIDARLGNDKPLSDTIVLVRLDPKRKRIAVLSLPRDLAVTIPGVGDGIKINEAYRDGGARKTLATVKLLFENATGKDFPVNSVIDVDFKGFQRAVDYLGGVYVDVDRRYYNPHGTGYAAIDVNAGYQKLDGRDALAYVRYRHTDSDLFRNARQQSFLRQVADQPAVHKIKSLSHAAHLAQIMRRYFRFDKQFLGRRNLAGLLKTSLYLALDHAPVNQIKLPGITESADPENDTRLFVSPGNVARAYREFMTGYGATNPEKQSTARKVKQRAATAAVTGLQYVKSAGESFAATADRKLRFPFYFPTYLTAGAQYVSDTPRIYHIRDLDGVRHQAYRIVVAAGPPGEYYGVQGLTWRDPPILGNPDRVRVQNGRKLLLFYDGRHLRMIAWRTRRAAYWVTNTLDEAIANRRLLAITLSLRRRHP